MLKPNVNNCLIVGILGFQEVSFKESAVFQSRAGYLCWSLEKGKQYTSLNSQQGLLLSLGKRVLLKELNSVSVLCRCQPDVPILFSQTNFIKEKGRCESWCVKWALRLSRYIAVDAVVTGV